MPRRTLSTGIKVTQTSSSVSVNLLYEEVHQHQKHKCFPLDEQRRVVLRIWKCRRLVSLKAAVCDWRFQVTLIIHWLCSFDGSCQIPLAGFAFCHLLHQVSMTSLFKGSHPSDCCTPLGSRGFIPFPVYWNHWAISFLSPYMVPFIQQYRHISVSCMSYIRPPAKSGMLY